MTQRKTKSLSVTSVANWKKKKQQDEILELPDGMVVKVRKLDLVDLAVTGYVPLALVTTLMETGEKLQDPEKLGSVDQEELKKLNGMLRAVALRAVVEPALSEVDHDDTVSLDDIGTVNLLAIFTACVDTSGSAVFAPFRT
jgi:hypothetical protein